MDNSTKKKVFFIIYIGTLTVSLITAFCLTFAFLNHFDAEVGYFRIGSLPVWIATCLALVGSLLIAAVSASCFKHKDLADVVPDALSSRICAAICAAVLLVFSVCSFLAVPSCHVKAMRTLLLLRGCMALPAAGYFVCVSIKMRGSVRNGTSFGVLLCVMMILGTSYFDYYTPVNGPVKIPLQLAVVALLIAFLLEVRSLIGNGYARPRCALALSLIAVICTIGASVPLIVAQFTRVIDKPDYALCAVLLLFLGLYHAIRIPSMYPMKTV